jgi:lysophospholipase L1-like esterase
MLLRFALVMVLLVSLGACTGEPTDTPPPTSTRGSTSSSAPPPADQVYVSLGDSYAAGYRPTDGSAPAGTTRDGFANLVATQAGLKLINVACSGATSGQLNTTTSCSATNRAPDAPDPAGTTQLDAAVQALRENEGHVGLVTIVVGGNDLAPCAVASDPLTCATDAVAEIQTNLAAVLPTLRAAAGADTPIVGLTYPDVFLGAWVSPDFPNGQRLAQLSVPLFRDVFNTALKAEYGKIDAKFVDITEATGGYGPLTELTQDPKYGAIPTPVAKVCALTYFCEHTDVHPTVSGHQTIASAILTAMGR